MLKLTEKSKKNILFKMKKRNPTNKQETISEMEYRLKKQAKELAEQNKNIKITKYDLKR